MLTSTLEGNRHACITLWLVRLTNDVQHQVCLCSTCLALLACHGSWKTTCLSQHPPPESGVAHNQMGFLRCKISWRWRICVLNMKFYQYILIAPNKRLLGSTSMLPMACINVFSNTYNKYVVKFPGSTRNFRNLDTSFHIAQRRNLATHDCLGDRVAIKSLCVPHRCFLQAISVTHNRHYRASAGYGMVLGEISVT